MSQIADTIRDTIYEGLCKHDSENPPRGYLGFSQIGQPCERQSWHVWRQTSGSLIDGRIFLLFDFGNKVEQSVTRALRLAGFVLTGAYPDQQLNYEDHGGFFRGHPDGIVDDDEDHMILEVKSANTNKHKQFEDKGVAEVYPVYAAQAQLYMAYSGLKRALFVISKKDDSSLYTEIMPFDQEAARALILKASRIIQTHDATGRIAIPPRITDDPRADDCKWCRYRTACFSPCEQIQSVMSCRSCAYFVVGSDFVPWCGNNQHKFKLKDVSAACPQWSWVLKIPW